MLNAEHLSGSIKSSDIIFKNPVRINLNIRYSKIIDTHKYFDIALQSPIF
jgi:hypothetical protein